jgi:methyltransferase family protein
LTMEISRKQESGELWRWGWVESLAKENHWTLGAELGVNRGHFSVYLVDHVPGLKMIAVDLWSNDGNTPAYFNYPHENNYERVLERFDDRPIEIMRMSTHEASLRIPDKSLDFVFIDASHDYKSVKQDIEDWAPKVKGMLLGHDFHRESVKKAVFERYKDVIIGPDVCWGVYDP